MWTERRSEKNLGEKRSPGWRYQTRKMVTASLKAGGLGGLQIGGILSSAPLWVVHYTGNKVSTSGEEGELVTTNKTSVENKGMFPGSPAFHFSWQTQLRGRRAPRHPTRREVQSTSLTVGGTEILLWYFPGEGAPSRNLNSSALLSHTGLGGSIDGDATTEVQMPPGVSLLGKRVGGGWGSAFKTRLKLTWKSRNIKS